MCIAATAARALNSVLQGILLSSEGEKLNSGLPPVATNGTRLYRVRYNSTVQVVLQGMSIIAQENHPTNLHGFNFYAIGKGLGNFYPVERNTIGVPTAGWTAIRFRAYNPGLVPTHE